MQLNSKSTMVKQHNRRHVLLFPRILLSQHASSVGSYGVCFYASVRKQTQYAGAYMVGSQVGPILLVSGQDI